MSCYGAPLGNCEGKLEREHFVPKAMQKLLGPTTIKGFPWQGDRTLEFLPPGSYGFGKVLCARHHDQLDGLDAIARDYFRNGVVLATVQGMRDASLLVDTIDGRGLEKWFLKAICGAISSGNVDARRRELPLRWIRVLFDEENWPDRWRLSVLTRDTPLEASDASFGLYFHWSDFGILEAFEIRGYGISTRLCFFRSATPPGAIVRPRALGMGNFGADGSENISTAVRLSWPDSANSGF